MSDFVRQLYLAARGENGPTKQLLTEAARRFEGIARSATLEEIGTLTEGIDIDDETIIRGGSKQSSDRMSSLASEVLRDPEASERERSLAASVMSQDETKGSRVSRPVRPVRE